MPAGSLAALLTQTGAAHAEVGRRPLSVYDELTGTAPFTIHPQFGEDTR